MKKTMLFAAAALMLGSAVTSCKKGENDPFLSLRSRKARVAGEWKLEKLTSNERTTDSDGDTDIFDYIIDGNKITVTNTYNGNTETTSGTVNTATWTFEKDGTFSRVLETTVSTTNDIGVTTTTNSKEESSGSWNFLGKVDEFKNKERIIVNTLMSKETETTTTSGIGGGTNTYTDTYTWADGDNSTIMAIDQLKNKEMIVKMESKSSDNFSNSSGNSFSSSSTATSEVVFTQD